MKKSNILLAVLLIIPSMLMITGCFKDGAGSDEYDGGQYVIAITADGSSSEATDYVLQSEDLLSGLITPVGKGIEQKSYRMYEVVGKTLLSITYQGTNIVPGYYLNSEGVLTKKNGEFSILRLHARNPIDEDRMIGMSVPRDGSAEATWYEINATEMKVSRQGKVNVYNTAGLGNEWAYFNDLRLVNNKLFAPYFNIRNSSFETSYPDSAYVAIFSWPGMTLEKVIKDERTGPLGAYATNDALQLTENGDMYSYSPNAIAAGSVPTAKPSGILRIKSGTTEFDPGYFFNIEAVSGGYKIACMKYVGSGKALAQIYSFKNHVPADKWTNRDCRLAVLDLNAKTITYVSDAPLHTGGGMRYTAIVDKDFVYMQLKTAAGIFLYKVDVANARATKGAQVQGKSVMALFNMQK